MRHPREQWLALAATGDLGWWRGMLVRRHTARCTGCAARAAEYGGLARELAALQVPEPPPGLVAAVVAQTSVRAAQAEARATGALSFVLRARSFAAVAVVLVLALLLLQSRSGLEPRTTDLSPRTSVLSPRTSVLSPQVLASASASPEAVIGETAGPEGRHRLAFYSSAKGGPVELSAGPGTALASHADPRTGALLITRFGIEGLP